MATTITKSQLKSLVESSVKKSIREQSYGKAPHVEIDLHKGRTAEDEELQDVMEAIADWESDYPSLMSKIRGAKRKKLVEFLLDDSSTSLSREGFAAESLLYFLDEIAGGGL